MIKSFTTLLLEQEAFSTIDACFDSMDNLDDQFRAHDPDVTQWHSMGIATVTGAFEGDSYAAAGTTMIVIEKRERILPGKVIRKAVDARVKRLEEAGGRNLSRREKSQIRDGVEADLLPQAFIRETQIPVCLMRAGGSKNGGYLIIASTSARIVEDVVTLLRKAFDIAFGYVPLLREQLIPPMLNAILDDGELVEERFHAAASAKFKGADRVVTVKNIELYSDTVSRLRQDGFRPMEMSLSFKEDSEFKINSKGVISGFKLYDLAAQLEGVDESNDAETFAASFLIYMRAIGDLLEELRVVMVNLLKAEGAEETKVDAEDPGTGQTGWGEDVKRYWYHAESDSVCTTDTAADVETMFNTADGALCCEIDEDVYLGHIERLEEEETNRRKVYALADADPDADEEEDDGEL
ncbi:recombination associated protein [Xanthomonas phage FoX4]|uniref:Recombination associated protein n=1 Tax=Xanthomonas phage FoX4 TaxID=2723900 RepID=A0A858WMP6_9CAUD|nr:exonuclease recombination-associated [Xanthomonas phage FoX4]QJI53023.1 recombination associated protein [Xanthomonas phage FoX4]